MEKVHNVLCKERDIQRPSSKKSYATLLKERMNKEIIFFLKYILIIVLSFPVSIINYDRMLDFPIQQQFLEHVVLANTNFIVRPRLQEVMQVVIALKTCYCLVLNCNKEFAILLMSIFLITCLPFLKHCFNFCMFHLLCCAVNYYYGISHIWCLMAFMVVMVVVFLTHEELETGVEDLCLCFVSSAAIYYIRTRTLPNSLALSAFGFSVLWMIVKSVRKVRKSTPVTIIGSEPISQMRKDE